MCNSRFTLYGTQINAEERGFFSFGSAKSAFSLAPGVSAGVSVQKDDTRKELHVGYKEVFFALV